MIADGLRALARAPVRNAVTAQSLAAAGYPLSAADCSAETARKLSAVDACIEILSNSIAKLPSYVMDNRTRERVPHRILEVLNVRPNEAMTPFIRKKVLETSRLEGGNGYDWIIRNPSTGYVEELIPIPWQFVEPWRDTGGRIWYTVTHPVTGEPMILPNENVCHYKGATRDGLKGISVLRRASEVVAAAKAAQEYDRSYYESGGQPAGVLTVDTDLGGPAIGADRKPLTDPDGSIISRKEKLRREWEKVHAGPSNSHRIAILDLGLTYKPLAATNKDAQFVENKEVTVKDIARFFGVPLYKLQEGKQAYSSNEQNAIEYVVSTLHPAVTQYEEEQTWKLLPGFDLRKGMEIRINLMAELKGDTSSRAAWYQTMTEISAFCPNDILALEDMPDVPGGDRRRASLNYVPLDLWPELSVKRNGGG